MKSLLQEASSVMKAVKKAWYEANQPNEFTVKVLEKAQKGFFGLTTKRPAVINILYEEVSPPKSRRRRSSSSFSAKSSSTQRRSSRSSESSKKMARNDEHSDARKRTNSSSRDESRSSARSQQEQKWNDELRGVIKEWIDDILSIMKVSNSFSIKGDQRDLTIIFDKNITASADDEGLFFASLSYLLLQGLKKKYRSKFRGLRIILKSPFRMDRGGERRDR